MSYKIYNGQEYDWSDKRIVCMADADGASVFPVEGPAGKKRMLSWSEDEAEDAYFEVMMEDSQWCTDCHRYGMDFCTCDEATSEEDSQDATAEPAVQSGTPAPEQPDSKGPELAGV